MNFFCDLFDLFTHSVFCKYKLSYMTKHLDLNLWISVDVSLVHLPYRFEPDMLAFSGCYYGGGDVEREELGEIRKRWKSLHVRFHENYHPKVLDGIWYMTSLYPV